MNNNSNKNNGSNNCTVSNYLKMLQAFSNSKPKKLFSTFSKTANHTFAF